MMRNWDIFVRIGVSHSTVTSGRSANFGRSSKKLYDYALVEGSTTLALNRDSPQPVSFRFFSHMRLSQMLHLVSAPSRVSFSDDLSELLSPFVYIPQTRPPHLNHPPTLYLRTSRSIGLLSVQRCGWRVARFDCHASYRTNEYVLN